MNEGSGSKDSLDKQASRGSLWNILYVWFNFANSLESISSGSEEIKSFSFFPPLEINRLP